MMKGVLLTLCVFIALSSRANAARIYECRDKDGNTIITNTTPPPGAICESRGRDLKPSEAAARKIDRQTDEANDKIEALINQLMNDPRNLQTQTMSGGVIKTGGIKQHVLEQIVELRKAQLRSQGNQSDVNAKIDALVNSWVNDPKNYYPQGGMHKNVQQNIVELRKAQLRNQGSTPNGNQQYDMEDKMNRQQREMEAKKDAMEVKMRSQELEIQDLEREKRMSEHNQRMQQLRIDMGQ